MAIDPENRFGADLARLTGPNNTPLLVAVSGGPDSLALLLLTHAVAGARTHAATVDHGLRPAAAAEAVMVAELCARMGIPHATLAGPMPPRAAGSANLSARARALRYALLTAHADAIGAAHILTAHHADDQAETLLMRLNRGSGVAGLAGVRARQGRVLRPLLGWRRSELAQIVAQAGLAAVADPSNSDDRFDRARIRKALAGADWIDAPALATSARWLGEAEAALDWSVDRLAGDRIAWGEGLAELDPAELPPEIVRRLAERCIAHVDPAAAPRGGQVARLVAALERGESATLGKVLAESRPTRWLFRLAPPRRSR